MYGVYACVDGVCVCVCEARPRHAEHLPEETQGKTAGKQARDQCSTVAATGITDTAVVKAGLKMTSSSTSKLQSA